MENKTHSKKKCLVSGPISPEKIATSIQKHQSKTNIGAHAIFLGQVRKDSIDVKEVIAIEYSAYDEMAENEFATIRETAFERFELVCMHIYHSLGRVNTGEISLFVFVSSKHRQASFDAIEWLVNEIKSKVPLFGKEILSDDSHTWKENKI